jgi:hypothetical protein
MKIATATIRLPLPGMERTPYMVKAFGVQAHWKVAGWGIRSARHTKTGDVLVVIEKVCANPDSELTELRKHYLLEATTIIE